MPAIRDKESHKGMSFFHSMVTIPTLAPHLVPAMEAERGRDGSSDVEGKRAQLLLPFFSPSSTLVFPR